eukprot:Rhum_TRINITY_DN20781_c0_g1::Rhum_TRINITY_DN20781_c0_g1_i1::g.172113::m.172113
MQLATHSSVRRSFASAPSSRSFFTRSGECSNRAASGSAPCRTTSSRGTHSSCFRAPPCDSVSYTQCVTLYASQLCADDANRTSRTSAESLGCGDATRLSTHAQPPCSTQAGNVHTPVASRVSPDVGSAPGALRRNTATDEACTVRPAPSRSAPTPPNDTRHACSAACAAPHSSNSACENSKRWSSCRNTPGPIPISALASRFGVVTTSTRMPGRVKKAREKAGRSSGLMCSITSMQHAASTAFCCRYAVSASIRPFTKSPCHKETCRGRYAFTWASATTLTGSVSSTSTPTPNTKRHSRVPSPTRHPRSPRHVAGARVVSIVARPRPLPQPTSTKRSTPASSRISATALYRWIARGGSKTRLGMCSERRRPQTSPMKYRYCSF